MPTIVRIAVGGFFVAVGLAKFFAHSKEVAEFRSYEVPWPEVAVPAVGTLEVVAGALLIVGLFSRLAAFALALDMFGAITTAGRVEGGAFHLGVAPAMLLLMLFLLWAGPGRASVDERLGEARVD
jgi:putative oxidoreductase